MTDQPSEERRPVPERFYMSADVRPAACVTCRHRHIGQVTCTAYPKRIPPEMLDGRSRHEQPYPGDHGIQYEYGDPIQPGQ